MEWTILVRTEKKSVYFHALEFKESKELSFWGQTEVAEPQLDKEGKYALPNPQENVPESEVSKAREKVDQKFP